MALITGQTAATSTTATTLCVIPPGPCDVVVTNVGPSTASVGPGTVTTSNGLLVGPGAAPTMFSGYQGSKGATLTFCVASGTATVSYLVSTTN